MIVDVYCGKQMQSITSFSSTFLGTAARIPCEVLKQQLQVGLYENVGEATVGIWRQDGVGGFFRGTVATLCREIPFYVVGSGFYHESKKVRTTYIQCTVLVLSYVLYID